jgi:hypothetical protein
MTGTLLRRLEKIEKLMNPPDNVPKVRIQVAFINPDGTVAGTRIIEPGKPDEIIDFGQLDKDETD